MHLCGFDSFETDWVKSPSSGLRNTGERTLLAQIPFLRHHSDCPPFIYSVQKVWYLSGPIALFPYIHSHSQNVPVQASTPIMVLSHNPTPSTHWYTYFTLLPYADTVLVLRWSAISIDAVHHSPTLTILDLPWKSHLRLNLSQFFKVQYCTQ